MRVVAERLIAVLLLVFFVVVGMLSYTTQLSASDNVNQPNQISTLPQVFQLLGTATPTATRTPTPINIGNFVWDDIDHDGRQDASEPGLAGVTVQLWNSSKTQLLAQTVTNANGHYTVIAPIPGNYRIRVLLANAMDSFSPKDQAGGDNQLDSDINPSGINAGFTDSFNLASNVISTTIHDAGIILFRTPTPTRTPTPINIGNFVWDDIDHDGRQDAGEPGMAGVTVQLWNANKTQLLAQTVTNANGSYSLIAPLPGDYRVRVILPHVMDTFSPKNQAGGDDLLDSDINPSGANIGFTDIFNLANNVISTTKFDAGIVVFRTPTPTRTPTPINVGNFVWDDTDHDGRQDAGEPGIGGVTVQLWNSTKTQLIASTVTGSNGIYSLIAPTPGNYRVRIVLPTAMDSFTAKDQAGGNDQQDSDINPSGINAGFTDVLTFANNLISITTIDGGIQRSPTPTPTRTPGPIMIGNFVWHDLDGDGRQDAGEPGMAGITVELWNSSKTQLFGSTVTNASGIYSLIAPLPGDYRVRVLLNNAAHTFAPKNQAGGDDQLDSDVTTSGVSFGYTGIITLTSNMISTTVVDAGIIAPLVLQPAATFIQLQPVASPTLPALSNPDLCAGFRLTSPLDGLPNGIANFYWDPANAQGVAYRITVLDEGRNVLAVFPVENATRVDGDVSQRVIGGSFQVIVQISALLNGQVICTDERMILRAAPDVGDAPDDPRQPQPTPTPTPRRGA